MGQGHFLKFYLQRLVMTKMMMQTNFLPFGAPASDFSIKDLFKIQIKGHEPWSMDDAKGGGGEASTSTPTPTYLQRKNF